MLALNSLFVHFSNFLLAIHNINNNGAGIAQLVEHSKAWRSTDAGSSPRCGKGFFFSLPESTFT